MYLKKLVYKNVGPLHSVSIDLPFNDDGSPKPLIIVGENGSGKSILLSNIIDSFYEMANKAYVDAVISAEKNQYQYYKAIMSEHITIGEEYLYSVVQYDNSIDYVYKCGNLSFESLKKDINSISNTLDWKENANYKGINANKKQVEEIFSNNVVCSFGANRFEKPIWMGEKYYMTESGLHASVNPWYSGKIPNPISAKNVTDLNMQWLLDIIVDSRPDIKNDNGQITIVHNSVPNLLLQGSVRKQVEQILSTIISKNVYFGLNLRNSGKSRFSIRQNDDDRIIVPTLDSLSTGELALFNIFSTIIRYADRLNTFNSLNYNGIVGIVVIDEIELHLHTSLQIEILPKLIKLFPKVQFVITTHSPLFLLGMRDEFSDNGFEVYQVPTGNKISIESFSEFRNAFDYMMNTQRYHTEVQKAIKRANDSKTLIVTEGATDWRHIKAALNVLSCKDGNQAVFENLDIDFLEYDPTNLSSDLETKLEMGNSTLRSMCMEYSKIKQSRKIIFIADRDDEKTNRELGGENGVPYKQWGNNVFSIILPIPSHRGDTPKICIEHYYSDDEIKTSVEIEGINRRLYIANEFDIHGRGINDEIMCEKPKICGKDRINIIEGSQGERVLSSKHGSEDNLALSKMEFAKRVYQYEPPFDNFCFDSFLELFRCISEIEKLPLE